MPVCKSSCMRRVALAAAIACLVMEVATGQNLSVALRQARTVPSWMNKTVIYEVWLNAFSKEGTLRGAIPGLQQVSNLGATVVYLGPIAKRSATPHASPYNIADYNAVDPQYGNEQDLRDFVGAAHNLRLKVMLDLIYYHSAPDSVMKDIPEFFIKTNDGKTARGFWPQPLPDFHNARVRRFLIDSLVHWVRDFGVDGFRCDVGAGVPVAFWEEARRDLDKVNRDVILLSEAERPDDQLEAFDISYDFQHYLTLRSVLRDGVSAIKLRENWEERKKTMPQGARMLHFSDNHDWRRAVREFGDKGALAAATLNFTLDGIPFLYNGQEVGDPTLTHWIAQSPIHWVEKGDGADPQAKDTLAKYTRLVRARQQYPALGSGELIWINNTEPASVLSFLRKLGNDEILVIVNLSNRETHVTIDLPVMDYSSVENVLTDGKTWFQLYSGRVSAKLAAYESIVGKRIPLSPLEPQ